MRLFVAIDLDAAARASAYRVAEAFRVRLPRSSADRGNEASPQTDQQEPSVNEGEPSLLGCAAAEAASWVRADNLHVTLRFLGNVEPSSADQLRDALAGRFALPPFEAVIARAGVFPGAARPRVLWLGVTEGAREMAAVHAEVERRLARAGVPPEGRAFTAHVTVARFRESGRHVAAFARRLTEAPQVVPIRWQVDHVTLYESRLSPKGSRYTSLLEAPLGAQAS